MYRVPPQRNVPERTAAGGERPVQHHLRAAVQPGHRRGAAASNASNAAVVRRRRACFEA